jgi:ribosome-associated toxin RatA of RatAB toxin-antitoxin module
MYVRRQGTIASKIGWVAAFLGAFGFAEPARAESAIQRYETAPQASGIKAGGARVEVHAPIDVVERVIMDYGSWSRHIRKFEKVKVVGRRGDRTHVYLQVPILKGATRIWVVAEFDPIKRTDAGDVLVARMLKGNVKRLDARWRLSKIDEQNTRVELELLLEPDWPLPVPNSLVTEEATNAAEQAVDGHRKAAERGGG